MSHRYDSLAYGQQRTSVIYICLSDPSIVKLDLLVGFHERVKNIDDRQLNPSKDINKQRALSRPHLDQKVEA